MVKVAREHVTFVTNSLSRGGEREQ